MPYNSVESARKDIKALKNKTDKEVEQFIAVFNKIMEDSPDMDESEAIKIALGSIKVEKRTMNDVNEEIVMLIKKAVPLANIVDYDVNYIYITLDDEYYRVRYVREDEAFKITDGIEKVFKDTRYMPMSQEGFVYESHKTVMKYKEFQEEQMIAIEPLYCKFDDVDADNEYMSLETIYKMVESMNNAINEGKLESHYPHGQKVKYFSIQKAWVNEVDCYIGEKFCPFGIPLAKVKFHDKDFWKRRKEGKILGLSIGARCTAKREVVEDEKDED